MLLTLYALMDSSFWFDILNLEWSIVYLVRGHKKYCISLIEVKQSHKRERKFNFISNTKVTLKFEYFLKCCSSQNACLKRKQGRP